MLLLHYDAILRSFAQSGSILSEYLARDIPLTMQFIGKLRQTPFALSRSMSEYLKYDKHRSP